MIIFAAFWTRRPQGEAWKESAPDGAWTSVAMVHGMHTSLQTQAMKTRERTPTLREEVMWKSGNGATTRAPVGANKYYYLSVSE